MFLLIVFLPLFASFFAGFFGFYIKNKGAAFLTLFSVFTSFFLSCYLFVLLYLSSLIEESPQFLIKYSHEPLIQNFIQLLKTYHGASVVHYDVSD
jgi:NADH:ubiquinone oxidoreductase subunit 5 (subunit L)/multisubunit Na+/H+ antiporter MnhA subunit